MTTLDQLYRIDNYIDTFALGHYARVLEAYDERTRQVVAFKVMRAEHLSPDGDIRWEYRAFPNEADLLMKLADSPHIVDLLDCGYLASGSEAPVNGEIVSFGTDIKAFAETINDYAERNWRPYLTMPNLVRSDNLFYLMKPNNQSTRRRLPTEEGLALALQFGQMLQMAHSQKIVYLDHKLEHVYWDGYKLTVIDLNSSRLLEDQVGDSQQYRADVHNLCVGILYPAFTGLSPQKTALRPQPSNREQVEARYRDISALDFGSEPTLSDALQALLQAGAAMEFTTAGDFVTELQAVGSLHGWDFPAHYTSPASREARDHMRNGLRKLREGQSNLREARDAFRDAAILDDITEDLEDELRRLVKAANDMLNNRVIP
jgi:serine/threonine protein kinase